MPQGMSSGPYNAAMPSSNSQFNQDWSFLPPGMSFGSNNAAMPLSNSQFNQDWPLMPPPTGFGSNNVSRPPSQSHFNHWPLMPQVSGFDSNIVPKPLSNLQFNQDLPFTPHVSGFHSNDNRMPSPIFHDDEQQTIRHTEEPTITEREDGSLSGASERFIPHEDPVLPVRDNATPLVNPRQSIPPSGRVLRTLLPRPGEASENVVAPPTKKKKKAMKMADTGTPNPHELVASTAADLSDGDKRAVFRCPLKTCSAHLPRPATLRQLWTHCSKSNHQTGLYQQNHYPCEFGCAIGFPDAVSRLDHYAETRCGKGELPVRCPEPGCKHSINRPGVSVDALIGAFLLHYTMKHASDAFANHDEGYIMDHACGLAFPDRKTMYCHYLGGITSRGKLFNKTAVSGHRDKVLRQFVAQENIVIDS
jgi:hypothetical protein